LRRFARKEAATTLKVETAQNIKAILDGQEKAVDDALEGTSDMRQVINKFDAFPNNTSHLPLIPLNEVFNLGSLDSSVPPYTALLNHKNVSIAERPKILPSLKNLEPKPCLEQTECENPMQIISCGNNLEKSPNETGSVTKCLTAKYRKFDPFGYVTILPAKPSYSRPLLSAAKVK
jgi:hypothetical protein